MNEKEQRRGQVLAWLTQGRVSSEQAQEVLGVSRRHLYRLKRSFTEAGPAALAHGNRGRPSPKRLAASMRAEVVALACSEHYRGYNHTHLAEALEEDHGMAVSRHTLGRILRTEGLRSPRRRRARQHRARRERAAQRGLLVQVDGSDHDWLEAREPRLTLVGAIDDATGALLAAHFCTHESSAAYLRLLRAAVAAHGVPGTWYSDRHSCFVRNDKEPWTMAEQLANRREPAQVARALEQLGAGLILAHSPQAKGRIERCWQTQQDRLVKALRRANACSLEEANALLAQYLPRHNARFAVAPADRADAHRRLPRGVDLDGVCSLHCVRTVAHDNTVRLEERLVQIPPGPHRRSYARCRVELQERLDGELVVIYQAAVIARQPAVPGAVLVARQRRRGRELAAAPPPARTCRRCRPARRSHALDPPTSLAPRSHASQKGQEQRATATMRRSPALHSLHGEYHPSTHRQVADSLLT